MINQLPPDSCRPSERGFSVRRISQCTDGSLPEFPFGRNQPPTCYSRRKAARSAAQGSDTLRPSMTGSFGTSQLHVAIESICTCTSSSRKSVVSSSREFRRAGIRRIRCQRTIPRPGNECPHKTWADSEKNKPHQAKAVRNGKRMKPKPR